MDHGQDLSALAALASCALNPDSPSVIPVKTGIQVSEMMARVQSEPRLDASFRQHDGLIFLALSILLVVSSSCATVTPGANSIQQNSAVTLTPCKFPKLKEPVMCGKYPVYENRAAQSGRMIALNIVVLPARSSEAKADPVFYLAGGPG